MIRGFYAKLAFENLKKHRKIYIPYILTCVITAAMFYIINSLANNQGIAAMSGGGTLVAFLFIGTIITGLFAVVFLFYTHSFIMKRRKKEFGLYNIFGMEKRQIGIVLLYETLYIAVSSIILGLLFGIILDKLMYLAVARILNSSYGLGFYVSAKAIAITLILFICIFVCIFTYAFIRVQASQPIELLKGESYGEKEPKTKWVLAVIGAATLIAGYALSIGSGNNKQISINVIGIIFIAVILVIIGTYFLFTAGSIAMLKLLKKNKKYYYQTGHFTSVSGMIYRMKQNAIGLANICILATMLLVTISTTTSFMVGRDDMLVNRYPYDILIQSMENEGNQEDMIANIHALADEKNTDISNEIDLSYVAFDVYLTGAGFVASETAPPKAKQMGILVFITEHSYHSITGETLSLKTNEIIISESNLSYDHTTLSLFNTQYTVKDKVGAFIENSVFPNGIPSVFGGLYVVVSDDSVLDVIYQTQKGIYGEKASDKFSIYAFDLSGNDKNKIAFYEQTKTIVPSGGGKTSVTCRSFEADDFMSTYGGMFFLGIFLGTLFLMAAILIIYYKQITEGLEDKERFYIMQKVGMDHGEIKRSIRSQILMVFFLPLVTAAVHVAFAFPILNSLLGILNLSNTALFAACTAACFGVFAFIYIAVYLITAKAYFKIAYL